MQNSTTSGAFDTLRRERLRETSTREKLTDMKKEIKKKNPSRSEKTKSLTKKDQQQVALANLKLAMKLHQKMDAMKQNIRKND